MKKIGCMATYPGRRKSFLAVIETLAKQLDVLYVYANGYDNDMFRFVNQIKDRETGNCKIKIVSPGSAYGDIKDMGKTWPLTNLRGYVFLVDDDILYPDDYCRRHIENIDRNKCISTVHGRIIKQFPIHSYYGQTESVHWRRAAKKTTVHICGTGTVCYRTDLINVETPPFKTMSKYIGMCDIWFSCLARFNDMKIIALARQSNWLTYADPHGRTSTNTLYHEMRNKTDRHCRAINRLDWNL